MLDVNILNNHWPHTLATTVPFFMLKILKATLLQGLKAEVNIQLKNLNSVISIDTLFFGWEKFQFNIILIFLRNKNISLSMYIA